MLALTLHSMRMDRKSMLMMMDPGALLQTPGLTTAIWVPTTRTSSTLGMMMDGMVMPGTMVKLTMTATTRTGPSTTTMAGMTMDLKKTEVNRKKTPATPSQRRRTTSRAKEKADLPLWALDAAPVEANGTTPTLAL